MPDPAMPQLGSIPTVWHSALKSTAPQTGRESPFILIHGVDFAGDLKLHPARCYHSQQKNIQCEVLHV